MYNVSREFQEYAKDPRIPCRYGVKCYQKNTLHHGKYKHPPKKKTCEETTKVLNPAKKQKLSLDVENTTDNILLRASNLEENLISNKKDINTLKDKLNDVITCANKSQKESRESVQEKILKTPSSFDVVEFIKSKFLVEMPIDFYKFWDFCKELNKNDPLLAFKDVDLELVGPFDVLAGKFTDVEEKSDDKYLIHCRYYYDLPEFQTVFKSSKNSGYHVGYFRDNPDEAPSFLASNDSQKDGTINICGDNIFAAVYIYLEELEKRANPFLKMKISKHQLLVKNHANNLQFTLSQYTKRIHERNVKIVTKTFNKVGLVIPYDKKTQLGYRELAMSNAELRKVLTKIKDALPEQKDCFLSQLQPVITYANIAADECDFGTGIELGWDILYFGIDSLNSTVASLLTVSYNLLNKDAFARIAEAHMKNRKKGLDTEHNTGLFTYRVNPNKVRMQLTIHIPRNARIYIKFKK